MGSWQSDSAVGRALGTARLCHPSHTFCSCLLCTGVTFSVVNLLHDIPALFLSVCVCVSCPHDCLSPHFFVLHFVSLRFSLNFCTFWICGRPCDDCDWSYLLGCDAMHSGRRYRRLKNFLPPSTSIS